MTTEDIKPIEVVEDPPVVVEDPPIVEEVEEAVGLEDLKDAAIDTGTRLREAGLATFIDPVLEGLGSLTRKAFKGLGAMLDEIDDKKRKK